MMHEPDTRDTDEIRVAAPVVDAEIPVCSEVMAALPDPADPDQAVLINVPVMVDGINFGDIVRLAPADDRGVRRITEVVVASGHVHMLAAAEDGEALDLVNELERMFPAWALRFVMASKTILSISVHPHLDPDEVGAVIAAWVGGDADEDDVLAMTLPCESELGRVAWT